MENLIRRMQEIQSLAKLVGSAPPFLQALRALPPVVNNEGTVLITGETGTGKELVGRAIHYLGRRAAFPFVAVNCGSLPDMLVEAEFFGHERGAFTDAHLRRTGLIAEAEKGTLFLDEIETMSRKAQVTLLRVLQDMRYRPVGSTKEQQADVRVVGATNAPIEQMVQSGDFRADLYYRLCIFSIYLPPLRERTEDILPLAEHFLQKYCPADKPSARLSDAARGALLSHDWPGNVRELENSIIRGTQLCKAGLIEVDDLRLPAPNRQPLDMTVSLPAKLQPLRAMKQQMIEDFEQRYLTRLMTEHNGNVSQAARTSGKERRELAKLLRKRNVDPRRFRYQPKLDKSQVGAF
jgi:DNA-binding NtrC family response regulator